MRYVYLNGEFLPENQASIPIDDRGFLYGDGVFTTIKVSDGFLEFFGLHFYRLKESSQQLRIQIPDFCIESLEKLIQLNNAFDGVWRMKIIITGGNNPKLALPERKGLCLITLKPENFKKSSSLKIISYPASIAKPFSKIKTLSYLDRMFIKQYAFDNQFDDAVVVDLNDILLETSFSNLFWVRDQEICFPDPTLPILHGIALSELLAGLKTDFRIHPVKQTLCDIDENTCLFAINTMQGVVSVGSINNKTFPVNRKLEEYLSAILKDRALLNSTC